MADLIEGALGQGLDDRQQTIPIVTPNGTPSIAGISVGDIVYTIDGEGMRVQRLLPAPVNAVFVTRGEFGAATPHGAGMPVIIGGGNRFYTVDPFGLPPGQPVNNPWVNLNARRVWRAQGDQVGPGASAIAHSWVKQQISYVVGALGIRQLVVTPNSTP